MRRAALPNPELLALVAVGGAIGTLSRYGLTRAFPASHNGIPWGTFSANMTGAFLLAVFLTLIAHAHIRVAALARALVAVGFFGGFTTFSALATDAVLLMKHHRVGLGVAYLLGSIAVGLAVAALGAAIGHRLIRARS